MFILYKNYNSCWLAFNRFDLTTVITALPGKLLEVYFFLPARMRSGLPGSAERLYMKSSIAFFLYLPQQSAQFFD